jgi:hypothetical protein
MGIDLWIPRYEYLYGHLSLKEIDFVTTHLSECDDGSYAINNDDLSELEKELTDEEKEGVEDLMDAIREELKKENGSLAVQIF